MVNFVREYAPVDHLNIINATVGAPTPAPISSATMSFNAGKFRGAQLSLEFQYSPVPANPTDDLIVEIYGARAVPSQPTPEPGDPPSAIVDTFPAMEFRLHPSASPGQANNYTVDVPEATVGHGFQVRLLSSGPPATASTLMVTLHAQRYRIQEE